MIFVALKFGPKWDIAVQKGEARLDESKKPKVGNARKLRGICFIDPEDGEYKKPSKTLELDVPMEAAMLCKTRHQKPHSKTVAWFNNML